MSKVNFSEFTWFIPRPKNQLAITIPNLHSLNLNPKLMEEMPTYITIGVSKAGDRLCLRAQPHSGYRLPKGGGVKDKDLIKLITASGVRLPARYTVWKEDDCWLATLDEHLSPKVNMAKPPNKPRTRNLKGILEEGKAL
jgi:hypothetical protein